MTRSVAGRFIGFLVLILLGVTSLACDVAFQGAHASATDEWRRTYTLAEGGTFELANVNGTVQVTPSADATSVEVVAERRVKASSEQAAKDDLKAFEIRETVEPSAIKIDVPRVRSGVHFGSPSREVNFRIKVPVHAIVKIRTTNGALHATGLAGPVKMQTTNGEVTGEKLAGAVDAGTTNGAIRVQVTALQNDGIRLDTTNGKIELTVPADAKASISARWVHGGFEATGLQPEGQSERRRYDGKLNGGGPRIELTTTNGSIRISS